MAKQAKIETKLTGDATGLKRELNTAKSEVTKYARDVTERLKAINAAVKSINIFGQINAIVAIGQQAINLFSKLYKYIKGTSDAAQEATAKALEAAQKMRDAAGKTDFVIFDAIREEAERAGIAADELNEKLKAFAERKITFEELAASIGTVADRLNLAESARRTVGTRYLADKADAAAAAKTREEARATERQGIREIVRDIARNGDAYGRGAEVDRLWDMLLEVANGRTDRAAEIYNENRGIFGRAVGVNMYGVEALDAAATRYAQRQQEQEAARQAEIDRQRADVEAKRAEEKAKADKDAAEAKARADKLAADEKARADKAAAAEKARAEAEAAKAAADAANRAAKIDDLEAQKIDVRWKGEMQKAAVTVSAPQAINSFNSIGGLVGADPTAINVARMEAERAAKIDAIARSVNEAVSRLDRQIEILRGE